MFKLWWESLKKICSMWLAFAGIILAIWPVPSEWNFIVSINLRLLLAVIFLVGLVICSLYNVIIGLYHSKLDFEELVVDSYVLYNNDGSKGGYEININYNPAYKSASLATIYLKTEGKEGVDPVYNRLCNGTVIKWNENQTIKIICKYDKGLPPEIIEKIDGKLQNTNRKRHDAKLVASPYYEPERID